MLEKELIDNVRLIILSMKEASEEAINRIYAEQIQESLELVVDIMETFNEIKSILSILSNEVVREMDDMFIKIFNATEKKDYIYIADLLQYRLIDLLDKISNL